jgi:hypothetical protein
MTDNTSPAAAAVRSFAATTATAAGGLRVFLSVVRAVRGAVTGAEDLAAIHSAREALRDMVTVCTELLAGFDELLDEPRDREN